MSSKVVTKQLVTCDRCKREFEKFGKGVWGGMHARDVERWGVGLGGGVGGSRMDFDLCDSCMSQFDDFMDGKPTKGTG